MEEEQVFIEKYCNEEQKLKYLVPLAKGEVIGAFCLSEPEAGSDATSQKTTAIDKGDYYLLNGTKNWITNGSTASLYVVMAQTDSEKGHKGINAFIVEKGWEGFEIGPKEALGIATGAYELALKYAQERKAFGKEIFKHQAIAFKLADMATQIMAAKMLIFKAATEKDEGKDISQSGAMAKLYASQAAMDITIEAVQIHGGNGYVSEYHVERMMRDAKITQIYEGTSEIQRIVISRTLVS